MSEPKYITREELTEERILTDFGKLLSDTYFICQYGIRKFLTDENVLFDDDTPEEYKKTIKDIYNKDKMTYTGVLNIYNSLVLHLYLSGKKNIFKTARSFIKYENGDKSLEEVMPSEDQSLESKSLVDKLQLFVASYSDEVFKNCRDLTIMNILPSESMKLSESEQEHCRSLLQDKKILKVISFLNRISIRYSVMIRGLCSQDFKITNCNKELTIQELSSYIPFISYREHKGNQRKKKDQEKTLNDLAPSFERIIKLIEEKQSSNSLSDLKDSLPYNERASNVFKSIIEEGKVKKSSYQSLVKAANDIYSLSRSNKSLRRAGLLIWDILHNPMPLFENIRKENSITNPTEASNYIISKGLYTNKSEDVLRMLNRHYNNTVACIKELTIIPVS